MQRSIWITHEDWELIKIAAAVAEKTLSRYLLHLHKMNIASLNRPHILTPAVCVDSRDKEMDQDPEKVLFVKDSDIKIPGSGEFFKPRPKGQDGIKKK